MKTIYSLLEFWKGGRATTSSIWTSQKKTAEKWKKQKLLNELIERIEITEKYQGCKCPNGYHDMFVECRPY